MNEFKKNKISETNETIAEVLRTTRQSHKIKLEDVARELNINLRHLRAIEAGRLADLPEGIYKKNYLREYARFLKIDAGEIVSLYEADDNSGGGKDKGQQENLFTRKVKGAHYFIAIPKVIKNTIVVALILVCLSYLGFSVKNIITPPALAIITPVEDLTTDESEILIAGQSEEEAEIYINDERILTTPEGAFEKAVNLKMGLNIITISAQKKYSRKNIVTRKILVSSEED